MLTFAEISNFSRALFCLWAMVLCFISIVTITISFIQKRKGYVVLSVIPFLISSFIWQLVYDIYLRKSFGRGTALSKNLGNYTWLSWFFVLLLLNIFLSYIMWENTCWSKTHVTPNALKVCADEMPCGVCYYRDGGQVIFSNECMDKLCYMLTGEMLLNGESFYSVVSDDIQYIEKNVWQFNNRKIMFGGKPLYEIIASDVTEVYEKTEALKKDTAELERINSELKEYNLSIDEMVRKKEILQAKVSIHDEMNRLMLSTVAATDSFDVTNLDYIFSLWQSNALLLCKEAAVNKKQADDSNLEKIAQSLGIEIVYKSPIPDVLTKQQRELYFVAANEAIANATKHAKAKNIHIYFSENETEVSCVFANDGNVPLNEIQFLGGLSNLNRLASEQGATIDVKVDEMFKLYLIMPINAKVY